MPRRRLGVALMLLALPAGEVQGLRRACGDHGRMAPHLTLVPPVNVRESDIGEALRVLQRAASQTRPFTLTLGPPATFMPDNPVLYLEVSGELDALSALRERVFVGPLSRALTWPFTPHVTICDSGEPARLDAAVVALADYRIEVEFERVHLLHEKPHDGHDHHRWVPFVDAVFAEPAVVGRGGFELELITGECLDPWSAATIESWTSSTSPGTSDEGNECFEDNECNALVIRAFHGGTLVGVVVGHRSGHVGVIESGAVAPDERRQGIGRHLIASFVSTLAKEGITQVSAWVPSGSPGEQWLCSSGFEVAHLGKDPLHLVRWLNRGV